MLFEIIKEFSTIELHPDTVPNTPRTLKSLSGNIKLDYKVFGA